MTELDRHRESKRGSKNGTRSEKDAAARFDSKPTSGSGAYRPGIGGGSRHNDFQSGTESVEWKYTTSKAYALRDSDLVAAWNEAVAEGKTALFGVEFASKRRWVVLSEADYLELSGGH